jgi:hypothetical protein
MKSTGNRIPELHPSSKDPIHRQPPAPYAVSYQPYPISRHPDTRHDDPRLTKLPMNTNRASSHRWSSRVGTFQASRATKTCSSLQVSRRWGVGLQRVGVEYSSHSLAPPRPCPHTRRREHSFIDSSACNMNMKNGGVTCNQQQDSCWMSLAKSGPNTQQA